MQEIINVVDPRTRKTVAITGFSMSRDLRPVFLTEKNMNKNKPDGYEAGHTRCTLHTLHDGDIIIPMGDVFTMDRKGNLKWRKGRTC